MWLHRDTISQNIRQVHVTGFTSSMEFIVLLLLQFRARVKRLLTAVKVGENFLICHILTYLCVRSVLTFYFTSRNAIIINKNRYPKPVKRSRAYHA